MVDQYAPDSALADPIHDAQHHFRALLAAMAEPGTLHGITSLTPPSERIGAALWGTLLTLCDLETTVWFEPRLDDPGLRRTLTFLTGAPLVADPARADFAVVLPDTPIDDLAFSRGTLAWPDRSTTLLIAVQALDVAPIDQSWRLTGPGIATQRFLSLGPDRAAADALLAALTATRTDFPLGLDAMLTCGDRLTALPRSTRLERVDTADAHRTDAAARSAEEQ